MAFRNTVGTTSVLRSGDLPPPSLAARFSLRTSLPLLHIPAPPAPCPLPPPPPLPPPTPGPFLHVLQNGSPAPRRPRTPLLPRTRVCPTPSTPLALVPDTPRLPTCLRLRLRLRSPRVSSIAWRGACWDAESRAPAQGCWVAPGPQTLAHWEWLLRTPATPVRHSLSPDTTVRKLTCDAGPSAGVQRPADPSVCAARGPHRPPHGARPSRPATRPRAPQRQGPKLTPLCTPPPVHCPAHRTCRVRSHGFAGWFNKRSLSCSATSPSARCPEGLCGHRAKRF